MSGASVRVEPFFQLSLLGLVASGYLAVAGSGHLDAPTLILTAAGLLLRAALVIGLVRVPISDRFVTILTIAYIGFYPLDYQFLSRDFLTATVHLVFFVAVIKILTAKTDRDYLYTAVISMLELLAAALISVQLNFFLFLGLYLLFAIATLSSGEIRRSAAHAGHIARRGSRRRLSPRLAALTLLVTVGVLVLTSALFFVLPRTAHAALRHLASRGYYLPGFSNEVTLGRIGEIKTRSTPVMHVRFYNKDGRWNTRWRGAGLREFDGRRWFNTPGAGQPLRAIPGVPITLAREEQRRRPGRRVAYRVDLNPLDSDALFIAGVPEFLTLDAPGIVRTPTGGYRLGFGPSEGVRYDVHGFFENPPSSVAETPDMPLDAAQRALYLRLPAIDARIPALAREFAGGQADDASRARGIEKRLRGGYGYTLELPSREIADPLAHFLFERRKGHCEYFASAMTVMLRAIDIPSRLVTGFLGGTFNPISGLYVIRSSDAHTWVEAYLPGRGWTAFDPTPPDPNAANLSLWSRFAMLFDAAETFWQEWVISYDLGRQLVLADNMERSSRRFQFDWLESARSVASRGNDLAREWLGRYALRAIAAILLAVVLIPLGLRLWRATRLRWRVRRLRQGQATAVDATALYRRFLALLQQRGYSKPPWLTPAEFVRSLQATDTAVVAERFTLAYQELRFGGKQDAAPRLSMLLQELERK